MPRRCMHRALWPTIAPRNTAGPKTAGRSIKQVELNLWQKIKEKAINGRRTGIGITAEGDMLAALGLQYGSENAIDFSVEVHKIVALEAYRGSVMLAKERGAFPIDLLYRNRYWRWCTACPTGCRHRVPYARSAGSGPPASQSGQENISAHAG